MGTEAALRGNQPARARHYLAERQVHKPNSAWRRRLAARLPAAESESKLELAPYRRVVTV